MNTKNNKYQKQIEFVIYSVTGNLSVPHFSQEGKDSYKVNRHSMFCYW